MTTDKQANRISVSTPHGEAIRADVLLSGYTEAYKNGTLNQWWGGLSAKQQADFTLSLTHLIERHTKELDDIRARLGKAGL